MNRDQIKYFVKNKYPKLLKHVKEKWVKEKNYMKKLLVNKLKTDLVPQ